MSDNEEEDFLPEEDWPLEDEVEEELDPVDAADIERAATDWKKPVPWFFRNHLVRNLKTGEINQTIVPSTWKVGQRFDDPQLHKNPFEVVEVRWSTIIFVPELVKLCLDNQRPDVTTAFLLAATSQAVLSEEDLDLKYYGGWWVCPN